MVVIIVAVYGLIIGSFINAVIWRIHSKKSVAKGRSMCPDCKHQLAWKDLIPVLSWAYLRGKCRYCSKPISLQYPIVELATATLFTLSILNANPSTLFSWMELLFWLYALSTLIILTVYDLRWYLLPDVVLLPGIVIGATKLGLVLILGAPLSTATGPILAAIAAGGFFYAIAAVSRGKWMGGGDIKLAFYMGLLLGLQKLAVAMVLAFNVAALVGVTLIVIKLRKRTDLIPFGPFLAGATVVAYLYGHQLIQFYLNLSDASLLVR